VPDEAGLRIEFARLLGWINGLVVGMLEEFSSCRADGGFGRWPKVPGVWDGRPWAGWGGGVSVEVAPVKGVAAMAETTLYGILAGYDGSPGSEEALSWAAGEARARGLMLTVCHAWAPTAPLPPSAGAAFELMRQSGEQVLARGLRSARERMAAPQVEPLLAAESAQVALCERSGAADVVVLGSRGRGRLAGLLLGSVSSQVAAHARGRVVVVRGHWQPAAGYVPGPVVVGADGSPGSDAAVEFAFQEAELRGVALVAVCALADKPGGFGGARRMEEEFARQVSGAEKEHPEVAVVWHVAGDAPRAALLDAATAAQLLVVGARGRGGVKGMLLGSVSQAVLHHAPCPVGVARPQ
jgi:nucleotide-binding universal stress UspA family protein